MKITFIRPNLADYRSRDAMQPLAFALLSGLTPATIDRELFDEKIEPVPLDLKTDLVALSVETFTARRAYVIADHYRKRGVPVVMGGYHPTLVPDEAICHADAIVCGEAEGVWTNLIDDVIHRRLKPRYESIGETPLTGLKFDRTIFNNKKYLPIYPVQFTRGCRFHCDFCSVSAFHHYRWRCRPVDDVLDEIKSFPGKYLLIGDDNIFAEPKQLEELLHGLKPLKRRWVCQASLDIVRHPGLLSRMAESGCFVVLIGFESLDNNNLRMMQKSVNLHQGEFTSAIEAIQRHGIMVYGSFVFGYNYDSPEIMKRTATFAIENNLFLCNFNLLMPLPGTRLFERLNAGKKLRYESWWCNDAYRYNQAVYNGQSMSRQELEQGSWQARKRFNTLINILRRAIGMIVLQRSLRNLSWFLLANGIAHWEIHKKNSIRLGETGKKKR